MDQIYVPVQLKDALYGSCINANLDRKNQQKFLKRVLLNFFSLSKFYESVKV